jgi:uncharacterized membrane protein YfcA
MLMLAALGVLLAGLAIGATSIGGVLVVPVLGALAQVDPGRAVAAASLGFAFTGAAAWWLAPRPAGGGRNLALDGCALAGAALGALTLAWLPAGGVRLTVGLIALGSGLYALFGRERQRATPLPAAALATLGLVVGCLSAWSGTGGPVVLLPLLALLGVPASVGVDAAQRVQLPVALAATAVNFAAGRLDILLGLGIGVLVLAGWSGGRWLARRLPVPRLRQAVALALIATGLAYL